ncbi:MAG: hypothetical protein RL660_501 [Bacteroidota bacterium]|jgi:L-alanine-DL-glutamate epimerase-like enolase superfamily enzyme
MLKLEFRRKSLPFIHPFKTAHGLKTVQPTLIVSLSFMGQTGYGEATEIVYYNVTLDDMVATLEKHKAAIEQYTLIDPERFWHFLHHLIPGHNFLICALDMAAWDLFGKLRKKKIHELWHDDYNAKLITDYTLGIDDIDKMLAKLKEKPWPIYKVKVGGPNDLAILEALRANTQSKIRIDANAGWTFEEALAILPHLERLNIELIEQPLAKGSWQQVAELCQHTEIPIIADEDCIEEKDVAMCIKHYDGINIKLTKCGGLTPALRMIEEAQDANKLIMMGCMNESMIGSAAMLQFSTHLHYLDADGPLLHSKELAEGLQYHADGSTSLLPHSYGLGIAVIDF